MVWVVHNSHALLEEHGRKIQKVCRHMDCNESQADFHMVPGSLLPRTEVESNLKPKLVCWPVMPPHCIPSIHTSPGLLIAEISCCVASGTWHDTHFIQHQRTGTAWSLSQPTWCSTSFTYYHICIWTGCWQKACCSARIYFNNMNNSLYIGGLVVKALNV